MKKYLILLFLFSYSIFGFAQENLIWIKFIVISHTPKPTYKIFITGDNLRLGNWDPSIVSLNKINDTTWVRKIDFHSGTSIHYKFTLGSWQNEALDSKGNVPENYHLIVNKDTTIKINIFKWKDETHQPQYKGQITGDVQYFKNFKGEGIKSRDIIVWLPPSYKKDLSKKYPVLYMQDGQNIFDPKTSSYGVDWQLDEAADSLIKAKSIKEIIIVGIYNTTDRMTEYLDTKLGHAYMKFVVNKLKPFIDKNFRTLPDRSNTAVGGSSAGGTISFLLAWDYPDIFSQAVCLSPAFHIQNINLVRKVLNYSGPKKEIRFYFDNGTIDLDSLLITGTKEMVSALISEGYRPRKDFEFYIAKGATHNEAAWAKRNWRYLEFMFGKSSNKN